MIADAANPTFLLLIAALLAAPLTAGAGAWRPALAAPVATAVTGLAFGLALWGWAEGGTTLDAAWAPTWDLRLTFALDGLATLYALLATGIGLAIVVYAARYLPLHLHHEHRPPAHGTRFYALILLFMGAMVGLVMAQDLLLIFLFWDLTAIASYFLIGYDAHKPEARRAALTALLVTGVSAVAFLVGALLLFDGYGTFALPELIAGAAAGNRLTAAGALMAAAGLAKSAQAPLHFWLPRAMAAPTPVSAYLHSAAMVAAGVFLLGRVHPLLARGDRVLDGVLVVGFASMAVGGVLALTRDALKPLLAYSTISQYGYMVVMLGLGGKAGAAGASFYVLAHALAKSALFLTAGAVTEATGETALERLGGLWRRLPALAVASGVAAAGLAALPLTIGFFKDELFFKAAYERGGLTTVLAVAGAALTFAYIGRFWLGVFLGAQRTAAHAPPRLLVAPVGVLAALILLGGVWVRPFERLAAGAAEATLRGPAAIHVAYSLKASPENLMAIAAIGLGALALAVRPVWVGAAQAVALAGGWLGPERWYLSGLAGLNRLSDRIHRFEVHDLRSRVATILMPAGVLVSLALVFAPAPASFRIGRLAAEDLPTILMVLLGATAAVVATIPRGHLSLALVLSAAGFSLAVVYALLDAPDVALVAVLIETIFALLFLGMLSLLPRDADHAAVGRSAGDRAEAQRGRWRDPTIALVAGALAFAVAWGTLSQPVALDSVTIRHIELTPAAHGKDIVTVILADFRGLDTMGEITVVGIAFLGTASLLRRWRTR